MLYLMACLLLFTNLIYYSYLITCHEINYSYPIKIKGWIILKDKSNVYLPSLRSYYDPTNETCVNNPLIKSDASINSCMDDPIVANNIACNEFNYTDDIYDDSDV